MAQAPAHMDGNPAGQALAVDALEGLSVGDALGEQFFARPRMAVERRVPGPPWPWTDDTNMALSILEILMEHGTIDCDALAVSFGRRYDRARGYGPSMHQVLRAIAGGEPWREITAAQFAGQASFGNGAAMRVAPLGAWFAGDVDRIVEEAHKSACPSGGRGRRGGRRRRRRHRCLGPVPSGTGSGGVPPGRPRAFRPVRWPPASSTP